MSIGNYSVFQYDTEARKTTKLIAESIPINSADKLAKECAKIDANKLGAKWKKVSAGENCVFQITGERIGYIVIKENVGPQYERALQSQSKTPAL